MVKPKTMLIRVLVLAGLVFLVLTLYLLRLMQIQVVEGESLAAKMEEGWSSTQVVKAARGEILDRNGRPLAVNTIGRDVVIDQAYLVPGSTNEIIIKLIGVMEAAGEPWIDNLPITSHAPFQFRTGESYNAQVAQLKKALEIGEFATVDDCIYQLKKKYKLEEIGDEALMRKVAGVRYEMTRRGFSMAAPYTFATDIKVETVPKIKERSFELQGVDVVESPQRQYVSGDIAPHLIGTIGPLYKEQWDAAERYVYNEKDGTQTAIIGGLSYSMTDTIGKSGVELAFEKYLRGVDGKRQIVQNARGDVIEVVEEQEPVPGNTVILSLDSGLQKVAQDALEDKILSMQADLVHYPPGKGHEADAGAAVVIDVNTGELLAAASYPSYNLSTYMQEYNKLANPEPGEPPRLINRALNGAYTPGSIFKPVVALAALDMQTIGRNDLVQCNMVYDVLGWPRYCLSAHGPTNVVNALRWSCNIFFYDVGRRIGIDNIGKYAAMLGLGEPTGIEVSEYAGRIASPELKEALRGEPWQEGDTVQASIGQLDTQLSPLQLANYCATLASNGARKRVTLLNSVRSYNFEDEVYQHEPEIAEQIDSPEAFNVIREGMVAASRIGTSSAVFGEGAYKMTVASKTGTPETSAHPNSTFIAYAPAEDPQIAVCIVIEKGWHGYTGAPVARQIFDAYFNVGEGGANAGFGQLLP